MREIKTLLDTFTDVSFDLENENAKKVIRKVAEFYKNDILRLIPPRYESFSSFGIRFFYFLKSDKCYVSILDM